MHLGTHLSVLSSPRAIGLCWTCSQMCLTFLKPAKRLRKTPDFETHTAVHGMETTYERVKHSSKASVTPRSNNVQLAQNYPSVCLPCCGTVHLLLATSSTLEPAVLIEVARL